MYSTNAYILSRCDLMILSVRYGITWKGVSVRTTYNKVHLSSKTL